MSLRGGLVRSSNLLFISRSKPHTQTGACCTVLLGRKALENPSHRVSCIQQQCGGGITWPNGYDFCPNFLRDDVPAVNVVTA